MVLSKTNFIFIYYFCLYFISLCYVSFYINVVVKCAHLFYMLLNGRQYIMILSSSPFKMKANIIQQPKEIAANRIKYRINIYKNKINGVMFFFSHLVIYKIADYYFSRSGEW